MPHRDKPAPRGRELPWLAVLLVLAIGGAWSGHRLGAARAMARHGTASPADAGSAGAELPDRGARAAGRVEPSSAERVAQVFTRLQSLTRESPSPPNDLEWQAAVDEILAGLSAADLALLHAQIPSAPTGAGPSLKSEVLRYWVAKDPDGALAVLSKGTDRWASYDAYVTCRDWSADHPQQALEWLHTSDFPMALDSPGAWLPASILTELAHRDMDAAIAEYRRLPPDQAAQVLGGWTQSMSDDPARREKLLALLQETGGAGGAYKGLLNAWALRDTPAAQAWLATADLSPQAREDATAGLARGMHFPDIQPGLDWWLTQTTETSRVPLEIQAQMQFWATQDESTSRAWLGAQPEGPRRDALTAAVMNSLAQRGNFEQAATLLDSMQDPTLHEDAVRILNLHWSAAAPEQAAAWKAGLEGSNKSLTSPAPREQ